MTLLENLVPAACLVPALPLPIPGEQVALQAPLFLAVSKSSCACL